MENLNRIVKNFGVLFVSHVISKAIGFFSLVFTARYLGVENFGILSFAIAFTGIWGVFFAMGMAPLVTREVARNKERVSQYLGNIITVKLILTLIVSCLIFFTVKLLGYPQDKMNVTYIIALSVIFNSFSEIFTSIFQAFEKMEYQSFAQILSSVLMLSGVLLAIRCGWSVIGFAFLYFLVNLAVLVYSFAICSTKFAILAVGIEWGFIKEIFRMALPFAISAIILTFFGRIDITMLSQMHGDKAVGYYSSAWRIVEIFTAIPIIYCTAIFPAMSVYYISSAESLKTLYQKSFKLLLVIVLFIQISITVFADYLIILMYGSEFTESIRVLRLLVWTLSFTFLNFLLEYLITAIDKQKATVFLTFPCLLLNILFNLFLIPRYGYLGAGISTLITQVLLFLVLFSFVWRNGFIILIYSLISLLFAGVFTFISMLLIKEVNIILSFCLGSVIYFTAILGLKVITRSELSAVWSSLKKQYQN